MPDDLIFVPRRSFLTAGAAAAGLAVAATADVAKADESSAFVSPPTGKRILLSCKLGMIAKKVDGKDLSGWVVKGKPEGWQVKDGVLRSEGAKGGEWIRIEPAAVFSVKYVLRYPEPVGEQEHFYIQQGPEFFKVEIARARTFGFLRDIEKLQTMGLAGGGKLNNCIIIGDEKIINTDLRYANEFARHKILDILGDFYLLGRPIRGAVSAHMTGHSDNIALLRQMRDGMKL